MYVYVKLSKRIIPNAHHRHNIIVLMTPTEHMFSNKHAFHFTARSIHIYEFLLISTLIIIGV